MKLSEIIKNYRKSHKVSMETLANRAGLSKTYISFIENGDNSGRCEQIPIHALRPSHKALYRGMVANIPYRSNDGC